MARETVRCEFKDCEDRAHWRLEHLIAGGDSASALCPYHFAKWMYESLRALEKALAAAKDEVTDKAFAQSFMDLAKKLPPDRGH